MFKRKEHPKKNTFIVVGRQTAMGFQVRSGFTLEEARTEANRLYTAWVREWASGNYYASRPIIGIYELVENIDFKVKSVDKF